MSDQKMRPTAIDFYNDIGAVKMLGYPNVGPMHARWKLQQAGWPTLTAAEAHALCETKETPDA